MKKTEISPFEGLQITKFISSTFFLPLLLGLTIEIFPKLPKVLTDKESWVSLSAMVEVSSLCCEEVLDWLKGLVWTAWLGFLIREGAFWVLGGRSELGERGCDY